MSENVEVKVIRPPFENVTSGRVFKPGKRYTYKLIFRNTTLALLFVCLMVGSFYLSIKFMHRVEPEDFPDTAAIFSNWMGPVVRWSVILNLLWLIPDLVATPIYVRSIEYSVKGESGEAMPEVYVKKGFITVTQNHVPFRTITNISSVAGPFDRLFGIGSVHIETAGYSGQDQRGPEENLEGIVFYEEVRDYILNELRKFREPYVTTTEMTPKAVNKTETDKQILETLKEIKSLLEKRG